MKPLPRTATAPFCPSEARGSIAVPAGLGFLARALRHAGPGMLVAVGYMDPGNWATDIEAGSRYGYALLFVVTSCGVAAMLLQGLAMRLGIVTGRDLAQLARERYRPAAARTLWLSAEVAIVATDIAEVLGGALAFKLLFGLPLWGGVLLTALDTVLVLGLQGRGFRRVEAIILALVATISICFAVQLTLARPDLPAMLAGLVPSAAALQEPHALYLATGILGATIMPHNLYLHSSVVQTRRADDAGDRDEAIRFAAFDTVGSLVLATLVNAAILSLAAASFHAHGKLEVADIGDAYRLLAPTTGSALAALLFGVALLASGQSATFTGTIAGQVVLEGFLNWRVPCWQQRLVTRALALLPALAGVLVLGDRAVGVLLVLSQVVLSAQLPFTMFPLIRLTGDRALMGKHANPRAVAAAAWLLFAGIAGADIWLVGDALFG